MNTTMTNQTRNSVNQQQGPPARPQYHASRVAYDPSRPVSVIIIGAGIGGITTSILLSAKVPNLTYTVIEKNPQVGGTWWENRYPGVRCDVPSHSYQLSFEPNPQWTEFYARGLEICEYYENVAKKYSVDKHLNLSHEVVKATWCPESSQWSVDVVNLQTGEHALLKADFLVSATGRLNSATLPNIPGLSEFEGPVVHTANWDDSVTFDDKKVAVIGNGASGMQVTPALLPRVQKLVNFARTKNWVSAAFNNGLTSLAATGTNPGGHPFSQAKRDEFAQDPATYLDYRRGLDSTFHKGIAAFVLNSPANGALRKDLSDIIAQRVHNDEEWLAKLIPDYAPLCKRLTPAPGYFEALQDPKAQYVIEPIERVTKTAITTVDGEAYEVDVIVAATGFPDSFAPAFPIVGHDGVNLQDSWGRNGPVGYPETYFGVMTPGFPNYFFVLQAQGTAFGGTVPVQCEQAATYIAKCIRKIQAQSYSALEPSIEATKEFNAVLEGFFADKTTTDSCSSWWKQEQGAGRVVVAWPGSGHHKWDISRDPRWEDFTFQRKKGTEGNRFEYFGNGVTAKEEKGDVQVLTAYLSETGKANLKELHESWTQGY